MDNKKKYYREWYLKNRKNKLNYKKNYLKKTNYKHEKTEEQRIIRNIKRKTRYHFPLLLKKCSCGNTAVLRHHNTFPIKFDEFDFMCRDCHNKEHGNIINEKEVREN